MAASLGTLFVQIGANTTMLTAGLATATRGMTKFAAVTQAKMAAVGASAQKTGRMITTSLSLPTALVGAGVIKMAADFESSMNQVEAVSGATGVSLEKLRQQAKDLGVTTKFSARQAAQGMSFLAMAGFDAQQILGAMPKTLQLAASAQMDLARAADITSNVLTGYGLDVAQLGMVNDVLVKSFTSANTNLEQLGQAFKFAGPIAKGAGIAFTETAAALSIMGNAGIQATMAGTSLRMGIVKLLDPTKEGADVLKRLGVQTKDTGGNLLSLTTIFRQLEAAGATTTDMIRIFGVRAGPGMAVLLSQGVDKLVEFEKSLKESGGIAAQIAETQMKGLGGAFIELKSAVEGLAIGLGDAGLLSVLEKQVDAWAKWVRQLNAASQASMRLAMVIGAVLIAAGPLTLIFGKIISLGAAVLGVVGSLIMGFVHLATVMVAATAHAVTFAVAMTAQMGKALTLAVLGLRRMALHMVLIAWGVAVTGVKAFATSLMFLAAQGIKAAVRGLMSLLPLLISVAASFLGTIASVILVSAALWALWEIVRDVGGSWKWLTDILSSVGSFFTEFVNFFTDGTAAISDTTATVIEFIAKAWLSLKIVWTAVLSGIKTVAQGILKAVAGALKGMAKVAGWFSDSTAASINKAASALDGYSVAVGKSRDETRKTVKQMLASWGNAPAALKRDVKAVIAVFEGLPEKAKAAFGDFFPALIAKFKDMWNGMQAFVEGKTLIIPFRFSDISSLAAAETTAADFTIPDPSGGDVTAAHVIDMEMAAQSEQALTDLKAFHNAQRVAGEQMTAEQIWAIHNPLTEQLSELWAAWGEEQKENAGSLAESIIGAWSTVWDGMAEGFAAMATQGKKFKDVMATVWKSLVGFMIKKLFQWVGAQAVAAKAEEAIAIEKAAVKVSASGVQVAASAAAEAPSIYAIPAYVAIGLGALIAGVAAGKALSAHAGTPFVPETASYVLKAGERVVETKTNEDLTAYLAERGEGGGEGRGGGDLYIDGSRMGRWIDSQVREGNIPLVRREDR